MAPRLCALFLLSAAAAACSRSAEPFDCPSVGAGDLVITEIRGPQQGGDTLGQWIELYNAGDSEVDLRGLRLAFINRQGVRVNDRPILVRALELSMAPGDYVTLGHHDPMPLPAYVDYTFITDYFSEPADASGDTEDETGDLGFGPVAERRPRDLLSAGRIEIEACGVLIDSFAYSELPSLGTLSLDGALDPDAEANDDPVNHCVDDAEPPPDPEMPVTGLGVPGTPQGANRSCK